MYFKKYICLFFTGALMTVSTDCAFTDQGPAASLTVDFADPSVIQAHGRWYAFGTNNNGVHVQLASSSDFDNWELWNSYDALPNLPDWVHPDRSDIWAPNVVQVSTDQFVLYFSGALRQNPAIHCVGTGTSSVATGPYTPSNQIFACDERDGGAIDASGYYDPVTQSRFVTYKVDGNAVGTGGSCNNEYAPQHSTPIMLQQVADDGVSPIGGPIQILDRDDNDGPLIEAPSLTRIGGLYYLFFSSNCYSSDLYDVSFATASSVYGPYTKRGPILVTPDLGLEAPGGAEVTPDGQFVTFHAGPVGARHMYTGRIEYNSGTEITLCISSGCKSAS